MTETDLRAKIATGIADWHDYVVRPAGSSPDANPGRAANSPTGLTDSDRLERELERRAAEIAELQEAIGREREQARRLAVSAAIHAATGKRTPHAPIETEFRRTPDSYRSGAKVERVRAPLPTGRARRATAAIWTVLLAIVAIGGTLAAIAVVR